MFAQTLGKGNRLSEIDTLEHIPVHMHLLTVGPVCSLRGWGDHHPPRGDPAGPHGSRLVGTGWFQEGCSLLGHRLEAVRPGIFEGVIDVVLPVGLRRVLTSTLDGQDDQSPDPRLQMVG